MLSVDPENVSTEVEQVQTKTAVDYVPTLASLRKMIGRILVMEIDFDAFCLDHFDLIRKRFTQNMDRIAKTSILLELADKHAIVSHLQEDYPEEFLKYKDLLIYESK